MKKIYIAVFLVFVVSLFLFIVSFVYLDKHNHKAFYYDISINGQYVGAVKVDKFVTEDKLIYKSISTTPFREFFTEEGNFLLEAETIIIEAGHGIKISSKGKDTLVISANLTKMEEEIFDFKKRIEVVEKSLVNVLNILKALKITQ